MHRQEDKMRLIYETLDKIDYYEVILTEDEVKKLNEKMVAKDFASGIYGKNSLNICVRQETILEQMEEASDATEERNIKKNNRDQYKGNEGRWKTDKSGRRRFVKGS